MKRIPISAAIAVWALGAAAPASALQSQLVASGFSQPLFVTAPAGDARLFVVELGGRIKVLQGGVASTYLDISAQVATDGERGLLGMAFAPDFATSGRFYVDYIDSTTKNTVVAAYTAPSAAAATADPASARTILTVAQPAAGYTNHKGTRAAGSDSAPATRGSSTSPPATAARPMTRTTAPRTRTTTWARCCA